MERKESESDDDFRRGSESVQQSSGEDDAWSEWTFDERLEATSLRGVADAAETEPDDETSSELETRATGSETGWHGGDSSASTDDPSMGENDGSSDAISRTREDLSRSTEIPSSSSEEPSTHPGSHEPDRSSLDQWGDDRATGDNLEMANDVETANDLDPANELEMGSRDLFGAIARETEGEEPQGLFDDLLSGTPIFENKEVLRPSYTPHELPHRTEQINKMATILVAALRGETPSNILIYGKTGTGKTASAKFVSQELESTSKKYRVPCEVEYINCEVTDTQYRVLAQLANTFLAENERLIDEEIAALEARHSRIDSIATRETDDAPASQPRGQDETRASLEERASSSSATADPTAIGRDSGTDGEEATTNRFDHEELTTPEAIQRRIDSLREEKESIESVPMTGWPTDRVYQVFFEAVDRRERVVVIMLDEIDKLVEKSGDDTLYNLSRMNSELEKSRVSIIGISNDLKFTDFLDPRVKSSLGEEEIVFPPYDASQLRDILQHRADVAFIDGVLTPEVIPLCAAFAAQEHGDARRALDLLRTAGELAERSQSDVVRERNVREAQDKIELDRVVEVVRTLPAQSKLVLFAIIQLEKNGVRNINTGEVFNIYKHLCNEVDTDVLTQRRVTDLISELDMLGIVNAVVVSKGRYGRTKEMSLSVPLEDTEAVLVTDSRLGDIEDVNPFIQSRFDA